MLYERIHHRIITYFRGLQLVGISHDPEGVGVGVDEGVGVGVVVGLGWAWSGVGMIGHFISL